jgi:cytochrome P450
MHRTQIMLDQPQYDFLMEEARRQGSSMAAVIRHLVTEHMSHNAPEDDALESIIGIGADGGGLAEADHDRIIYGLDKL